MSNIYILLLIIQFPLLGCLNKNNENLPDLNPNPKYMIDRSKFDKELIQHFPDTLLFEENTIVCSMNQEKNNVGLILYEYGVDSDYIKQINARINNQYVAKYKSTDTCLLVVNRFETYDTYSNSKTVIVYDSSLINQPCYDSLYPIPHFLGTKNISGHGPVWLDPSFTIYVLEAKPDITFENYPMEESIQMPVRWKNGYSRGVAISEKEKTVIHWLIMW